MKNKMIVAMLAVFISATGVMAVIPSGIAAASPADKIKGGVERVDDEDDSDLGGKIKTIVNMMLYLLGAIAVVMIVIGGIRYATSNGDSSTLTSAKNTILYAVVGLVVAIMAYAIVNFVVDAFIKK